MLIPDNQRTTENIKKNIYDNIRNTFYNYALKWNAIWRVWRDNSPNWGGNWAGSRIIMHDTIPYNLRMTNTKTYEGITGEINQKVSVETQKSHSIGNENYIRGSLHAFNQTLIEKFQEGEYNGAGEYLTYKLVKSYGVNYQIYNLVGELEQETHYYTKEFEINDSNRNVTLYTNEDCTSGATTKKVCQWSGGKKYVIKWTGERFYKTITVNPYVRQGTDQSYSCPTLSANNSNGVTVSNNELAENTWKLFNGTENAQTFKKDISTSNPVIIYFQISKSFKLTSYTIVADNSGSSIEYPKNWSIQGSNDRITWTTLDSKSNQTFTKNQTRTYSVTNNNYFLFFRLVITASNLPSSKMQMRRFTFSGRVPNTVIDYSVIQPFNIGVQDNNGDFTGVNKVSTIESTQGLSNTYTNVNYSTTNPSGDRGIPVQLTQEKLNMYNVNTKWSTNNVEQNVRQDNLVKKEDYEQLNRLLKKIDAVLKLRDGWFDSNGRCSHSCQVACQNRCQLSCQGCNTSQCHNQKCGTH